MAKGAAPSKPHSDRLVCKRNPRQKSRRHNSHSPPRLCVAATLRPRGHLSLFQAKPFGQLVSQFQSGCGVVLDGDANYAELFCLGKQANDLEAGNAKPITDFLLA